MVALNWHLHKDVVMFFKLLSMLDKGPNMTNVNGDHC